MLFLLLGLNASAAAKPNILFIFTDDQRGSTIHDAETANISTPNLDRLAKQGMSFSNCYLFGANNGAVCKPSRAQLMTGRTFFQLPEVVTAGWAPLPAGQDNPLQFPTFPELLKRGGYRTFATGKQHNGNKWIEKGFSEAKAAYMRGMGSHWDLDLKDFSSAKGWKNASSKRVWSSEVFANAAIDFLKRQDKTTPFMAYVSFTAPHDPRTAPKEYHDKYPADKIALPQNFQPVHPFPIADMYIRDEKLAAFPRPPKQIRKQIGDYYAMIEATDHHIGRILKTLEEKGLADNTIVIFSSDNGLAVGQHGLMGKQNVYEHSIRLPMIVKGPGIAANVRRESLIYLHDLAPTILDLAGVAKPQAMHARSFLPQIKSSQALGRSSIYSAYDSFRFEPGPLKVEGRTRRFAPRGHGRSIRQGEFKLIIYHLAGETHTLLYNLKKDPKEMSNLAESPEMQAKITQLTTELKKQMIEAGDQAQLDIPGWGYPEDRSR